MSDDLFKGKGLDKFKDVGFKFNKENLPQAIFVNPQDDITRRMKEAIGVINATQRREEEYKQEALQTWKNIEKNTAGLNQIVPLLSKNIEHQEEILNFLKEAFLIGASKTKEEAESKWRVVMNKATQLTADVETIQKLQGFASTILSMFADG